MRLAIFLAAVCSIGLAAIAYWGISPFDLQAIRSATGTLNVGASSLAPARAPIAPVRVTVAQVRTEDVPIHLSVIGTVQAYNTVNVKTRIDGEIVKILFEEGQDVKEGDPLAIIDPRPLAAQLRQQEAMRQKSKAQLDGAVLDLNRYETLALKNYASQQQVDQQRALVEQYRAQLQNDEAQIEFAKTQLEYTTIQAPISGRAGIRQVDRGNVVRAGDGTTFVVLTQLQPISVVFTLAATVAAQSRLKPGRVNLPVMAYAADGITELDRGKIDLVDNQVDQATGTIKLKGSFPNAQFRLWPGNFVNGRIVVETRRQGLTVPSVAVRHGPRGDFVWVVGPNNTAEAKGVRAVQSSGGRTLVERGLSRGEHVVTDGHFRLENGSRIEIVPSGPAASPSSPLTASQTN